MTPSILWAHGKIPYPNASLILVKRIEIQRIGAATNSVIIARIITPSSVV